MLKAVNLHKAFGKREVVRGVNIQVEAGNVVGLLGPNGAGKTTCFYMIVGLIAAGKGEILVDDVDITHQPVNVRSSLGVGYLPQDASIFRKLTVEQNIMSILEIQGELTAEEREDRLQKLMEDLGIAHLGQQLGISLSGGERRRVEIARALAANPRFILLDERDAGHLRPRLHPQRGSRAGLGQAGNHRRQRQGTGSLPGPELQFIAVCRYISPQCEKRANRDDPFGWLSRHSN